MIAEESPAMALKLPPKFYDHSALLVPSYDHELLKAGAAKLGIKVPAEKPPATAASMLGWKPGQQAGSARAKGHAAVKAEKSQTPKEKPATGERQKVEQQQRDQQQRLLAEQQQQGDALAYGSLQKNVMGGDITTSRGSGAMAATSLKASGSH